MAGFQGRYGQMDYTVDMVFCIDATGSMEDFTGSSNKIINMVKQNAINFYTDFNNIMTEQGKRVHSSGVADIFIPPDLIQKLFSGENMVGRCC